MNLENGLKNSSKELYKTYKEPLEDEKKNAKHGDIFWTKYYNSSQVIRESPAIIISNDQDKEDIIILQGTSNVERPDFDVEITISYVNRFGNTKTNNMVFRTNKTFTINRKDLDNKCFFNWDDNEEKNRVNSKIV